ncbi:MAG: gliding motility-associated C-terminal domain-containing protein [Saprospiraceae bacterium]|nr:gliding motility-associated C-terminal domain-containing protein [Saprospiraceae bacterium]
MRLVILSFCLLLSQAAFAQTNIQGVINDYAVVTDLELFDCSTRIAVADVSAFSPGDRVLLIQMKGASIDSTDTANFGDILNLNGSGNWEFGDITQITGNNIILNGLLQRSYEVSGRCQLIRVPVYADATVVGPLTALDWNGSTGGVLVFWVENTLTLNAEINLNGKGFRGGAISNNPDGGCGLGSPGYFYPLVQPGPSWPSGGAEKGEGIAEISANKRAGRGPLATGGGGGNKHNTGGGGGSNFSAGGKGGNELQGCTIQQRGGIGGNQLFSAYQDDRLFLGGGGGCGDDNNGVGSIGEDGGGLLMVVANTLVGNGQNILANGNTQNNPGTGIADGAGGGGAGGALWLQVENYTGTVSLQANGGDGGDQQPTFGCVGPGGGGGAGALVTSGPLPANVNWELLPGEAGIFTAAGTACTGTTYGAEPGALIPFSYLNANNIYFVENLNNPDFSLGPDTTLCAGEFLQLTGPLNADSYLWQDGSMNPDFLVSSAGTYWLGVIQDGCFTSDSILVSYLNPPTVDLGPDTTLCAGELLFLNGPPEADSYLWQDGSTESDLSVSTSGVYSLTIDLDGCFGADTIQVDFASSVSVDLGLDTLICRDELPFLLYAGASAGASYLWQDGSTDNSFSVITEGTYWVEVSNMECLSSDTITVSLRNCVDCNFFVPNVFSPDDDGINDQFQLFSNCVPFDFDMQIYDRWGELVYHTSNPADSWKGYMGSKRAGAGVYVYLIDFKVSETDGVNSYQLSGDVTLMR